jgi:hypothetical protein
MTNSFVTTKPIRLRIPNFIDVLVVSDPEQIQWLNQHESVTRPLNPSASWLHRFIEQRLGTDLAFGGKPLPVFLPRTDAARAERQKKLDDVLEDLRGAPGQERDEIAAYVSGEKDSDEIGVLVQQWCGRLFLAHYRAARETYEAGRLLASWPSAPPWRTWRDRMNGRLAQAKSLLAEAAEGDLHCIHATSIGMENVARSVRRLRKAAQQANKQTLSPDDILRDCLVAPPAVVRGCSGEVHAPFLAQPLTKQTVVVFLVARAYAISGDLDVAFLSDGWSGCPAHRVIPEMLRAVWHSAHHDEADDKRLLSTINNWSRLWSRAVS